MDQDPCGEVGQQSIPGGRADVLDETREAKEDAIMRGIQGGKGAPEGMVDDPRDFTTLKRAEWCCETNHWEAEVEEDSAI